MAASLQNLRALVNGVEPISLLPGQLCFNLADKVMYVGDGSDTKTAYDGTQTPGAAGGGWYSLPLDFDTVGQYFIPNPIYYGDSPADLQVLTWSTEANHAIWSSAGGTGTPVRVYATTNAAVDAAPGATVSEKISAAIVVSFPGVGDSVAVAGSFGETYEGFYVWTGTEWIRGAVYADPPNADYATIGVSQLADAAATLAGTSSSTSVTPESLQSKLTDDAKVANSNLIASATAVKEAYDRGEEALLLAEGGGAISEGTIYVSPLGDDTTGQRGTRQAFATLTAALAAASQGDTIFMAPGNFTENVTLTKGVNLIGAFNDQNTQAGTTITGNFVLDLTATTTSNTSITNIRFATVNSNPAFRVANHSFASGGITVIADCFFAQNNSLISVFCFDTDPVQWTRSLYLRRPDFDGNIRHQAGDAVGQKGYMVLDRVEGTGSSTRYYEILGGTVEFRDPSNAISPVHQLGGIILFNGLVDGISQSDDITKPVFGEKVGVSYQGTSSGSITAVLFNGSNTVEGDIEIGAGVIYGWNTLSVNSSFLSVDPGAINYLDGSTDNYLNLTEGRPQSYLLRQVDTAPVEKQRGAIIDDEGTLHAVTSSLIFVTAPTVSTDPGISGQVAMDASYFYIHNGTIWTRIALKPW